ncbi:endopeptidase La [Buchnera aphidicola]|uniref:endopeptidase La n=1 Tax=Buchnera aphidicola TaxID=9 RepID=UPI00346396D1
MNNKCTNHINAPVLTLRDVVVYPNMITPLFVNRKKSIKSIEQSINTDKQIILVTQKEASIEIPKPNELFSIGIAGSIIQMIKLPNETVKILVKGLYKGEIQEFTQKEDILIAKIKEIKSYIRNQKETDILIKIAIKKFEKYIEFNNKIPTKILNSISNIKNPEILSDIIASHIILSIQEKQKILEMLDIENKLEYLITIMQSEIDLFKIEQNIKNRIKKQIEKNQKEYYLNEQMKAIQKEIEEIENQTEEVEIPQDKINISKLPKKIKNKIMMEIKKLKMMPSMSAEATVIRNYIDWVMQVPWKNKSKIKRNINEAQEILNGDHFGLHKVKERILEYLAVQSRMNQIKGPILCLIGPPGVGKTSLGRSIAKATGRKYIRMALGGISDESSIRGHRRTYIGSMPGKIIQNIIKTKVNNPLFLLDEIDKICHDSRVDPTSALLEVLDPEQNTNFNDHYLEIDYDLSNIMFIATANSTNIPAPLLDRMEIINVSSYTESEKFNIAKKYLIPKQIQRNALKQEEIDIQDETIKTIIDHYVREAGVRNLEKEIAKICRKVVKNLLINQSIKHITINNNNLKKYLGIKRFNYTKSNDKNYIGQVNGLAWTSTGGDLLKIEVEYIPGKGKLIYTGSLGKVMKESIQTALTVVRSRCKILGIDLKFYEKHDIHVHIPEGATPKDGPSAGISICTAIISALMKNPIKSRIAMTGEITLNGNVLPIGGLKEKLLAANRGKIKTVIIPHKNIRNLEEISPKIFENLNIKPVKKIEEVLILSLYNPVNIK